MRTASLVRKQKELEGIVQDRTKEILSQKNEIEKQKLVVEERQKEILDSIKYAKRIQAALLTNERYIHRVLAKLKKK